MKFNFLPLIVAGTLLLACGQRQSTPAFSTSSGNGSLPIPGSPPVKKNNSGIKTVHVFVALCDNKYQGIVPVGSKIGNGQDPANNLYWGAAYGLKVFFTKKNSDWKLISTQKNISDTVMERMLFKNRYHNIYLLADAYNGRYIKPCTVNFFNAASGAETVLIQNGADSLLFGGAADLLVYTGHDGLMDFTLEQRFLKKNNQKREAIMLACYSKHYFSGYLKATGCIPVIWSTGLMAPEAYILHAALRDWTNQKSYEQIRVSAAQAYATYQHCSFKAARNLLVTGY